MKFKKPKTKDVQTVIKGLFAFESGKRLGRGIIGQMNPKSAANEQMIRGGMALASLVAAAAYKGKNQELVIPGFVGLAAEQVGEIIDSQAADMIEKQANPGFAEKFVYDVFGLGCPGGCGQSLGQPRRFPMLAQPTIREIEWDQVFTGDEEQSSHTGDFAGA